MSVCPDDGTNLVEVTAVGLALAAPAGSGGDDGMVDEDNAVGSTPSRASSLIGLTLGGTYKLERLLGEGGMGSVYLAAHLRVPRKFAVKLLNPEALGNREVFERFRREAEIASALGHENIVQVIDFNHTDDGRPYMVLEFLDGDDLAAHLQRGRLTVGRTLSIVDQLAGALELAHAHGIVHRDLKPQNIFVCRRSGGGDLVKILDFGISKVVHQQSMATRTGAVFGTPNYMSPEQAEGNNADVDHRTDLFALGAIVYECLTGKLAFQAPTIAGIVYQVCHGTPKPITTLDPALPPAIEAVVTRAMAKAPADRYQSARELKADFAGACREHQPTRRTVVLPPSPTPTVISPPAITTMTGAAGEVADESPRPRHVPRSLAAAAAVAIGLVGIGFWGWKASTSHERKTASMVVPASSPTPVASASAPVTVVATPAPATPPAPAPAPTPLPTLAEVELRLVLDPPGARVQLDGVTTAANPLRLPRSNETHQLVVTADGFHSQSMKLAADHSQDLPIRLRPRVPSAGTSADEKRAAKPGKGKGSAVTGPRVDDL